MKEARACANLRLFHSSNVNLRFAEFYLIELQYEYEKERSITKYKTFLRTFICTL